MHVFVDRLTVMLVRNTVAQAIARAHTDGRCRDIVIRATDVKCDAATLPWAMWCLWPETDVRAVEGGIAHVRIHAHQTKFDYALWTTAAIAALAWVLVNSRFAVFSNIVLCMAVVLAVACAPVRYPCDRA
jgi:hypothetical protein